MSIDTHPPKKEMWNEPVVDLNSVWSLFFIQKLNSKKLKEGKDNKNDKW